MQLRKMFSLVDSDYQQIGCLLQATLDADLEHQFAGATQATRGQSLQVTDLAGIAEFTVSAWQTFQYDRGALYLCVLG